MEDTHKGETGLVEPSTALLGAMEASKRLGIHRKTLYRYTKAGIIPAESILPGRKFRYHPDTIERIRIEWQREKS